MLQKVTWLQENALNAGKESDSRKNVKLGEKVLQKRKKDTNVRENEKVIIMKKDFETDTSKCQ